MKGKSTPVRPSVPKTVSVNQRVQMIPMDQIVRNPDQPRKNFDSSLINEMAESIKLHGIINAITVRKIGENKYQIVAGEQRYRAAEIAGLSKIPCTDSGDRNHAAIAIIENCLRANLSPVEKAQAFQAVIDTGVQQNELAEKLGLAPSTISDVLSLLTLPPDIKDECLENPKYAVRVLKKIAQSKDSDSEKRAQFENYKAAHSASRKTAAGRNARRDQDILEATARLNSVLKYLNEIDSEKRVEIITQLKALSGELSKIYRKFKA